MPMSKTYLALNDDVGTAPAFVVDSKTGLDIPNPKKDEPEALNSIGVNIPIPTMVGDDVVEVTQRVTIDPGEKLGKEIPARIIPGTRIVETTHPAVVNLLLQTGQYKQVDAPRSEQSRTKNEEG